MTNTVNDHLVLIAGETTTGKSASLKDINDPKGVMYLGSEAGKKLPFRNVFKRLKITDPWQVPAAFDAAETMPDIHTIVIDSITFLMEQFETQYVIGAAEGFAAWSQYGQFFKNLMQDKIAKSTKNVIITGHTFATLNEQSGNMESRVTVKGALAKVGVESYFSCVIATKIMQLKDLKDYENDLLTITEDDKLLGYKNVFQTKLTKKTFGEKIRSPIGMWTNAETYIDNNVQHVIDKLKWYYDEEE